MITYSVWNPATRQYDYFETSEERPIHAPAPKRGSKRTLGATPEEAAWKLPSFARHAGGGAMPKGRVASLAGDDASGTALPTWWPWAAAAALVLVWRSR